MTVSFRRDSLLLLSAATAPGETIEARQAPKMKQGTQWHWGGRLPLRRPRDQAPDLAAGCRPPAGTSRISTSQPTALAYLFSVLTDGE